MAARGRRKKVAHLNFKDAKSNRIPAGTYPAKVVAGEIQTSKASGEDFVAWQFEVLDGEFEGRVAYLNNSLQPQALWRLREVLESFGTEVPEGAMDLDPEEYIGCEAEITIEETEYEGRRQSKVVDVMPLKAKGKRSRDEEEPPARKRRAKDEEPEEEPAPRGRRGRREEPEEDEPPTRGRRGKKKGITAAEVEDMDEEELSDLADEHDLDVDFKRLRTQKAKANAVLDALEDAGLLNE